MAKIVAPKSSSYDARVADIQKRKDLRTLRGKAQWTAQDRDDVLKKLIDLVVPPTS
jgi:hypothetical protein